MQFFVLLAMLGLTVVNAADLSIPFKNLKAKNLPKKSDAPVGIQAQTTRATEGWFVIHDFLDSQCSYGNLQNSKASVIKVGECVMGMLVEHVDIADNGDVYGYSIGHYGSSDCSGDPLFAEFDSSSSALGCVPDSSKPTSQMFSYYSTWGEIVPYLRQMKGRLRKAFPSRYSCVAGTMFGWGHVIAQFTPLYMCVDGDSDDDEVEPTQLLFCGKSAFTWMDTYFRRGFVSSESVHVKGQGICTTSVMTEIRSSQLTDSYCTAEDFGLYTATVCY